MNEASEQANSSKASVEEAQAAKLLSLTRTPSGMGASNYDFALGCLVALQDFNEKAESSALLNQDQKKAILAAIDHFRAKAIGLAISEGKKEPNLDQALARKRAETDDDAAMIVRTVLACANQANRQ